MTFSFTKLICLVLSPKNTYGVIESEHRCGYIYIPQLRMWIAGDWKSSMYGLRMQRTQNTEKELLKINVALFFYRVIR